MPEQEAQGRVMSPDLFKQTAFDSGVELAAYFYVRNIKISDKIFTTLDGNLWGADKNILLLFSCPLKVYSQAFLMTFLRTD